MPTLEYFDNFRRRLLPVQQVFDEFCNKYGYSHAHTGRYPRIRVRKVADGVSTWVDFSMCWGDDGRYREEFDETTPFDLAAGAFVDIYTSDSDFIRYGECFVLLERVALSSIMEGEMRDMLESSIPRLRKYTVESLQATGVARKVSAIK